MDCIRWSNGLPSAGASLLDAVIGGEALFEGLRELVGEPCPRLLADLVLEAVQNLVEHLPEVVLGVEVKFSKIS